jgi:hypothetical protein
VKGDYGQSPLESIKEVYLKQTRGISFEEIIHAKLLGITRTSKASKSEYSCL